ncbi:hypothetical protein B1C78_03225 [Thioalkalivibrio denitrificans]|uniref:Phage tail tape measure protein domain-containing protein n=2 Tax=Thioalkalivibrio denitrificans TaxID=108003 RepID=A0A1V3NSG6_9GAMM|nr:hypothetical protein B1C78_03225 [Thioalkalivibrio denitrificans]
MRDTFLNLILRGDGGPLRTEMEKSARHMRDSGRRMQRGLEPADQQMRRVSMTARRLTGIIAGLAGAASMGALIRSQITAADTAGRMARRIGESAETVSTLGFAAEQSGTNIDSIGRAYDGFIRRLDQFREGSGKAGRAARALGLDIFDAEGKVRPFSEILLDAADRLSMVEDPALKSSLATKIFGRSAGDLIPLLDEGADGIRELQQRARDYGREIDMHTADAAREFNDTMNELRGAVGGASRGFVGQMLPSLLVISKEMRNSATEADGLAQNLGKVVNQLIKWVALGTRTAIVPLEAMGEAIGGGIAYVEQLARGNREGARAIREHMEATQAFEGPLQNLVEFYDALYNAQERATEGTEDVTEKTAERLSEIEKLNARLQAIFGEGADAARSAAQERADAEQKAIEGMRRQVETIGHVTREEEILYEIRRGNYREFTEQGQQQLLAYARELDAVEALAEAERERVQTQERMATEAQRIYQATRTPAEQLAAEIEHLNELLDAGALSWDTYARAVFNAQEKFEGAAEEAVTASSQFAIQGARNIQSAFADFLFDPFEQGLQGMLRGFVDILRRMASEAIAAQLGARLFGDFGGTGQLGGAVGGVLASVFHDGGVAGESAPVRRVPLTSFLDAPRYHSGGIAGDEEFAILKRGEEVLTQDNPRHRDNAGAGVRVVLVDDRSNIADYLGTADGERAIVQAVQRNRMAVKQVLS